MRMLSRRQLLRIGNNLCILPIALLLSPQATSAQALKPTNTQTQPTRRMIALVFGQSNAANFGEGRRKSRAGVFYFFRGRFGRARDPLPGANGIGGSVWTRLGDQLIVAKLFTQVIFVPAAIGATEIALWAPGGLLHEDLLRNIRETLQAGHRFTHLFWHQGESDAVLKIDPADYQLRFKGMLAAIRALGVDAPIFVAQATRCGDYLPNEDIRWAQHNLVDPAQSIFAGPDTDSLDNTWRHDGCHFSNRGLKRHATMWLDVIRKYQASKQ